MYHISKDKRSVESSVWIFEALEQMMQTTCYSKITVSALCKEAKVGRVTFYRHYDTIDDVLRKKCDDECLGLLAYMKEFVKTEGQQSFLVPFLRYWYVHPEIIHLLFEAKKDYLIEDSMQRILQPGGEQNFPEADVGHITYIKNIRFSIALSVLRQWFENERQPAPDELAKIVIDGAKDFLKRNILL